MPTSPTDVYYDPYDYDIDANPHPIWRKMRDDHPLYYNDKFDFYALTRFADVKAASVDWRSYSSHHGSVLEMLRLPKEVLDQVRNMLFEDPPWHDLHRSILARVFTPRRIGALEPKIRELCGQFLDPHVGGSGFDYVQALASKLPMYVISGLLGIPEKDWETIRHLADAGVHRDEGETDFNVSAQLEMQRYFAEYAAFRRENPVDDLMTDLIQATFEDENGVTRGLTDNELLNYMGLVAAAGNETVTNLVGWTAHALAAFPDQRERLHKEPELIPNAIEEMLRFEAPSPVQARLVTKDVEWHGETVPAGSAILLLTASAGRDDREYENPDAVDVGRKFETHVTFGYGIHFCLGAALARLEGRVALEETLKRFPTWDIDHANAEMIHTSTVRGWAKLPITL
ncbi:MAG: cytochrome P450 [Acidimicrobiia bacterium]